MPPRSARPAAPRVSPARAGYTGPETGQAQERRQAGQRDRLRIDRGQQQRSAEHCDEGRDPRLARTDHEPEQDEGELDRVGGAGPAEGEDAG